MSPMPMPAPPVSRFVPAITAVTERRGVTVVVDRQPNLCRWAVHSLDAAGRDTVISGPSGDQESNPSNRQLAAQITDAVSRAVPLSELDQVFTSDWMTAELLRAKTALPVSGLYAPPSALAAAREAIAKVESRMVENLTIACDSSRGKGRTVNGCGWVLAYSNGADPVIGSYTSVSTHGGIRAGELAAIRRGLQSTLSLHPILREGVGSLKVLTDSKPALDLLDRVSRDAHDAFDDSDSVSECRRILGSARGINISFEWVRGHDGHPLNELADRLAVLSRRNREMKVDELTNARMIAAVRKDAREICAALQER
ncbi:RNase H family protein [Arthrobacter sp. zg-Y1110]|uniref:RNase H family protein n=1 Tax=Arthrobacter sp. zg-Y1110 TaxID=2886932 RepID=UPI001D152EE6|nr:RNase H family protein [Arthrobacter sp. zg-Y1110]MCC3292544.1 ribonuclease H [Arthrobacter sp. zg-Y1110]UWX87024.1 ribonuclease H [Arthrobacter sp. zg-Y1110]